MTEQPPARHVRPMTTAERAGQWRGAAIVTSLCGLLLCVAGGVVWGQERADARTQHHGTPSRVQITEVGDITAVYKRSVSSRIQVRGTLLGTPAAGRQVTLWASDLMHIEVGDQIRVLVDPDDATHVEIPGYPSRHRRDWVILWLAGLLAVTAYPLQRAWARGRFT